MAIPRLVLELLEDPSSAPLARLIGRNLFEHHAVLPQDVEDLEVIVGELCANVTHHARSQEGFFRITVEHHGDRIVLTVEDHGPGIDTERFAPVGSTRPDGCGGLRIGGYGLHLIRKLSDELRFETRSPHGTTVFVEKRLRMA
jgi:anti-sigma regulatory factor (Ser/Thr protein kinase)